MSNIEIQAKVRELKELKILREELETEIAAIEDTLKAVMGEQEEMLCGEYKIIYQTVTSTRFDTARFKRDHADLAEAYMKTSTLRRFSVR